MIGASFLLLGAVLGEAPSVVLEAPQRVVLGEPIPIAVRFSSSETATSSNPAVALEARNLSFDVRFEDGTTARFLETIGDPPQHASGNGSATLVTVEVPTLAVGRWTFTPHALVGGKDLAGAERTVEVGGAGDVIAYGLEIETSRGLLRADLLPKSAPAACLHVARACRSPGFGTQPIDRVWSKAMIRIPPPLSPSDAAASRARIDLDPSPSHHERGSLSLWRDGVAGEDLKKPSIAGAGDGSFFVLTTAEPWMDGRYCVFGRVTAGIEVADEIVKQPLEPAANGELSKPKEPVRVVSVKLVPVTGKPK